MCDGVKYYDDGSNHVQNLRDPKELRAWKITILAFGLRQTMFGKIKAFWVAPH